MTPSNDDLRKMLEAVQSTEVDPAAPAAEEIASAREAGEIALRRERVLAMRFRRLSEAVIAVQLKVSEATVSRDMQYWRDRWKRDYGPVPSFEPTQKIGETIALLEEAEATALANLARLQMPKEKEDKLSVRDLTSLVRQRMHCVRVVVETRGEMIGFLQDLGLLDRQLGASTTNVTYERADAIRARLDLAGVFAQDDLVSQGEREWLGLDLPEETPVPPDGTDTGSTTK